MVPLLQGRSKALYRLGMVAWAAAMFVFWSWWLEPAHIRSWLGYGTVTLVMIWVTALPAYFILIFHGARRMPPAGGPVPAGRIAMVVTKAPSEPFAVVRKTLLAMLDQIGCDFDVWLADEDPAPETVRWCAEHGILISTRKGVADYHRTSWPRRTRCKEGNLAYFYDHFGYERYDFVAQFDADHVPEPTYLREVLRPFADPRVGYVSAPSICDANAAKSWAARGRLYAEASMHGALQVGYNNGWAPLCIGSHYAVRTAALKEIGGLGPDLAEDHSTTLMMNAGGWKGVHAVEAIAHGDGPATFADLAVQEFQWSRSLMTILLKYSPVHVPRLPLRLKFQFLFSQLWYPLFSLFMALTFVMPIVALASGHNFANVTYPDFFAHFLPLSLTLVGLAFFCRSTGTFRPHRAKILGWESIAFLFVRWPWSLAGCAAAMRDHLTGSFVDFRITPKGANPAQALPLRVLAPYLALSAISAAAMMLVRDAGSARGFYVFAGINAVIYAALALVMVVMHARENGLPLAPRSLASSLVAASILVTFGMTGDVLYQRGPESVEALSRGLNVISLTQTRSAVAGAGHGGKTQITRFNFKWNGFEPRGEPQQGA